MVGSRNKLPLIKLGQNLRAIVHFNWSYTPVQQAVDGIRNMFDQKYSQSSLCVALSVQFDIMNIESNLNWLFSIRYNFEFQIKIAY